MFCKDLISIEDRKATGRPAARSQRRRKGRFANAAWADGDNETAATSYERCNGYHVPVFTRQVQINSSVTHNYGVKKKTHSERERERERERESPADNDRPRPHIWLM